MSRFIAARVLSLDTPSSTGNSQSGPSMLDLLESTPIQYKNSLTATFLAAVCFMYIPAFFGQVSTDSVTAVIGLISVYNFVRLFITTISASPVIVIPAKVYAWHGLSSVVTNADVISSAQKKHDACVQSNTDAFITTISQIQIGTIAIVPIFLFLSFGFPSYVTLSLILSVLIVIHGATSLLY